jgi:hypothetical protein
MRIISQMLDNIARVPEWYAMFRLQLSGHILTRWLAQGLGSVHWLDRRRFDGLAALHSQIGCGCQNFQQYESWVEDAKELSRSMKANRDHLNARQAELASCRNMKVHTNLVVVCLTPFFTVSPALFIARS